MYEANFVTFGPRKCAPVYGFPIFASSILLVSVILLENDDVSRLTINLEILYFETLKLTLNLQKHSSWGVLITCANNISKILTLKLVVNLMIA